MVHPPQFRPMINKMKKVYIIGAGASYSAAQMPLGNELGWNYEMQCGSLYQMENGRPLLSEIEEKKREFYHLGEFLEIAGKIYPELSGEKEKWGKAMESAMMYSPDFLFSGNKKYFFDEMLAKSTKNKDEDAVKKIKNVIYAHIADKCRHHSNKTIYSDFLKSILFSNVSIISLNFDTLIRENYYDKICIDYKIQFSQSIVNRGYKKFDHCIPLLKLHGSIDWGWCKNCGAIILNGPWVKSDSYYNIECEKCKSPIDPFIIVPFENTEEYPEWFNALWKQAEMELSTANTIYFIGYSIPEYDTDMLNLIKNSINKFTNIVIIDPQAEIIKSKLLKIGLRSEKIEMVNSGFKEYLESVNVLKT